MTSFSCAIGFRVVLFLFFIYQTFWGATLSNANYISTQQKVLSRMQVHRFSAGSVAILYVFGAERSTKGLVSVKLPLSWKNNTFPSETGVPITVMITTLYYCLVHAPQICSQRQMAWIFVYLYSDDRNKWYKPGSAQMCKVNFKVRKWPNCRSSVCASCCRIINIGPVPCNGKCILQEMYTRHSNVCHKRTLLINIAGN